MQGVPLPPSEIDRAIPAGALASRLHFDNAIAYRLHGREEPRVMRRVVASFVLLMLAVVLAPTQAQAFVYSVFGELFPFTTNEPGMLFLTGVTLLSLAYVGGRSR
jgi:hypothetical protein